MRLICWIKGVWRTFSSGWFLWGMTVSGHDYVEGEDGLLRCRLCKHLSPLDVWGRPVPRNKL